MGKKFEDLTFGDDWMFQAVLRDPEISAELVELLLGIKVRRVEYPELEKVIEPFYSTKGSVTETNLTIPLVAFFLMALVCGKNIWQKLCRHQMHQLRQTVLPFLLR